MNQERVGQVSGTLLMIRPWKCVLTRVMGCAGLRPGVLVAVLILAMSLMMVPCPPVNVTALIPVHWILLRTPGRHRQVVLFIIWLCLLLTACTASSGERLTWFTGVTMGTGYSVKITGPPPDIDPQRLERDIARLLEEINGLMSTYREDSELSRFNRGRCTDWVAVSPELVYVLKEAQGVSRLTGRAFDVTVGPLVNLWGFGPSLYPVRIPTAAQIAATGKRVGFELLQIRSLPPALRKRREDIYIDLSAIAKGYGVDRVAELLEVQGIHNYLVDIGGEERIKGHSPLGVPWRIAIEQPVPEGHKVQRIIEMDSHGVATSGTYRNYFEWDGKRYSHIIDPRTGWPVAHKLASVTVLSDTRCALML